MTAIGGQRLLLVTAGTRGDVEPFVALAERAERDGWQVHLALTEEFVDEYSSQHRVEPLDGNFRELIAAQGASPWRALRSYGSVVKPLMESVLRSSAEAIMAVRPDAVVAHPKILSASMACAAVGAQLYPVEIVPTMTPTRAYPAAGVLAKGAPFINRLTFRATAAASAPFRKQLRTIARDLAIDPTPAAPDGAVLCPVSPSILDRPSDWPSTTHLTGVWRRATSADQLDPDVDAFLADGSVVFAGFSSMAKGDAAARTTEIVEGIRLAGFRALVATGWGGLAVPAGLQGDDVFETTSVPHDLVFPRVCAAIHHGGAGTVHTAARAGVMSVVVPFLADQPWWGARLHERGLAPEPIEPRRLDRHRVNAALGEIDQRAPMVRSVAGSMEGEDGEGAALQVVRDRLIRSRTASA
jgi:sterol 3beta-glucosyltransferase